MMVKISSYCHNHSSNNYVYNTPEGTTDNVFKRTGRGACIAMANYINGYNTDANNAPARVWKSKRDVSKLFYYSKNKKKR